MNIQRFQTTIGYEFANADLLMEALRHSSYVNEQTDDKLRDNERMEFLGDAIKGLPELKRDPSCIIPFYPTSILRKRTISRRMFIIMNCMPPRAYHIYGYCQGADFSS